MWNAQRDRVKGSLAKHAGKPGLCMHTEGWLVITTAGEWDTGTNNQDTNENPNQHKRKLAVRIKQEEIYDPNWNKKDTEI